MAAIKVTKELAEKVREYYITHNRESSIRDVADKFNLSEVQVVRILNIKY